MLFRLRTKYILYRWEKKTSAVLGHCIDVCFVAFSAALQLNWSQVKCTHTHSRSFHAEMCTWQSSCNDAVLFIGPLREDQSSARLSFLFLSVSPSLFGSTRSELWCAYTSLLLYLIASLIALLLANLILWLKATNQPTRAQLFLNRKIALSMTNSV